MYTISVPVDQFLSRALFASVFSEYKAFVVAIARTADGDALQEEIIREWASLDDLTGRKILFICPRFSSRQEPALVEGRRATRGAPPILNNNLSISASRRNRNPEWEDAFVSDAGRLELQGNADIFPPGSLNMGSYAPLPLGAPDEQKLAFTRAASEAARFFGINERWLPCVVVLSIQTQEILVFHVDSDFSVYSFTKNVLSLFQDYPQSKFATAVHDEAEMSGFEVVDHALDMVLYQRRDRYDYSLDHFFRFHAQYSRLLDHPWLRTTFAYRDARLESATLDTRIAIKREALKAIEGKLQELSEDDNATELDEGSGREAGTRQRRLLQEAEELRVQIAELDRVQRDTPDVFISYSRADAAFTDRLSDSLERLGYVVWVDRKRLQGGARWPAVLQSAIERTKVVLVVLTPSSSQSSYVLDECHYARRRHKPIIPLSLSTCEAPLDLARLQLVNFMGDFGAGLSELTATLKTQGITARSDNG